MNRNKDLDIARDTAVTELRERYRREPAAASVKYRKQPALSFASTWDDIEQRWVDDGHGIKGREDACAQRTGHILKVNSDHIECLECGATWRNEGY